LGSPSSASARPRAGRGRGYYSTGYGYGYRASYYYSSGYHGYGYGYGRWPGYYYARPYYSSYNYPYPEYVTYEPNTVTYSTSSYRADASADDRAVVTIQIPADESDIWIQGEKSRQTKSRQEYISPPFPPGKKYFYEVRARWQEGDRTYDETRSFAIFLGRPVLVDFTRPAASKQ